MYIDGQEVHTETLQPFALHTTIRMFWACIIKEKRSMCRLAIDAALKSKKQWAEMPWEQRAAIFLESS